MLNAVVPNSAQPFNFQEAFGLTVEEVRSSSAVWVGGDDDQKNLSGQG